MVTWSILNMQVLQEGSLQDVVRYVDWLVVVTDNGYETSTTGQTVMGPVQGAFIPYTDLTEQIVLDWVFALLGAEAKAAIETSLQSQIANLALPRVQSAPLPWG